MYNNSARKMTRTVQLHRHDVEIEDGDSKEMKTADLTISTGNLKVFIYFLSGNIL